MKLTSINQEMQIEPKLEFSEKWRNLKHCLSVFRLQTNGGLVTPEENKKLSPSKGKGERSVGAIIKLWLLADCILYELE